MIQGVQGGSSLVREAIEAALASQNEAARKIAEAAESPAAGADAGVAAPATPQSNFGVRLDQQLREVDSAIRSSLELPSDFAAGRVRDFHEVAARLKEAELTFKFALEVRNKLIDAYRETMRMTL
jgi:flagellar hook-basal body complex protein FliE